ncbi:MAG: VanZ family protein [Gemmataceae bacterium]
MKTTTLRSCLFVLGWLTLLGIWTYLLLLPSTKEISDWVNVPITRRFLVAKALHLGVYFLLAYLAAYLPRRTAWWAILAVHAALTELGQQFLPGRTGTLLDVMINLCGVLIGLLLGARLAAVTIAPTDRSTTNRSASAPN